MKSFDVYGYYYDNLLKEAGEDQQPDQQQQAQQPPPTPDQQQQAQKMNADVFKTLSGKTIKSVSFNNNKLVIQTTDSNVPFVVSIRGMDVMVSSKENPKPIKIQ